MEKGKQKVTAHTNLSLSLSPFSPWGHFMHQLSIFTFFSFQVVSSSFVFLKVTMETKCFPVVTVLPW